MLSPEDNRIISMIPLKNGFKTFRGCLDLRFEIGSGDAGGLESGGFDNGGGDDFGGGGGGGFDSGESGGGGFDGGWGDAGGGFSGGGFDSGGGGGGFASGGFDNANAGGGFESGGFDNAGVGDGYDNAGDEAGFGDQSTKEYRLFTRFNPDTELQWKIVVKCSPSNPSENSIGLELVESPISSAFVIFRLTVCGKYSGQVIWDKVGARVFRKPNSEADLPFIDADDEPPDGHVSPPPTKENYWHCDALNRFCQSNADQNNEIDQPEPMTLHCILDIPTDYAIADHRRCMAAAEPKIDFSIAFVKNTFSTIRDCYEQIDSPLCQLSDIILVVTTPDFGIRQFYCHRIVLRAHSSVFRREFESTNSDSKSKKTTGYGGNTVWLYPIIGYDLETVKTVLRYFYLGIVDVPLLERGDDDDGLAETETGIGNRNGIDIPRLIYLTKMAAEFGVDDLITTCENQLIRLSDTPCYRLVFARLATTYNLRRLKLVLVATMANVRRHLNECQQTAIFSDLITETERKTFVPVEKLN